MEFSERLRLLRKQKRMTQAELAQKSGLSSGAIGNYESGKRNKISVEVLCRLADALGVEPEELGMQRRYDLERKMQESMQRHVKDNYSETENEMLTAIIQVFWSLNDKGRHIALERIQELSEIDRYKG